MATLFLRFIFFYFKKSVYAFLMSLVYSSQDPQTSFFNKIFITNWFYGTIHTFKNYSAIVFSIFSKISSIQTYPKCWFEIIYLAFVENFC